MRIRARARTPPRSTRRAASSRATSGGWATTAAASLSSAGAKTRTRERRRKTRRRPCVPGVPGVPGVPVPRPRLGPLLLTHVLAACTLAGLVIGAWMFAWALASTHWPLGWIARHPGALAWSPELGWSGSASSPVD